MEDKKICSFRKIKWYVELDKNYEIKVLPFVYNHKVDKVKILTTNDVLDLPFCWPHGSRTQTYDFSCSGHTPLNGVKINHMIHLLWGDYLCIESKNKYYPFYKITDMDKLMTQNEIIKIVDKAEKIINRLKNKEIEDMKESANAIEIESISKNF